MSRAIAAAVLLSLAASPLYSQQQTLANISASLDELEQTLLDIQRENDSLKTDTETLRLNLTESAAANERLSALSTELRRLSTEQAEAFRRQSALLDKSERNLRNWRLASVLEGAALAGLVVSMILIK